MKRIKVIYFGVLVVLAIAFLLSGCKTKERNNQSNDRNSYSIKGDRGNSTGNISNGGYVVSKAGVVYYYDGTVNAIYKDESDGTGPIQYVKDAGGNLNLADNWIIYASEGDGKIYRVSLDGAEKEKICDDKCNFLNVIGEWIFYVNESDNNRIYKIKIDGSEKTRINDSESTRINVDGEWIYYCKLSKEDSEEIGDSFYYPFGELYKLRVDGTEETKLSDVKASFLNVVGDWIYYSDVNDGISLYKMKTDGTEKSKIIDDNCYDVNVAGENIYYSDMSVSLHKTDINGKNKVTIGEDGRYMNINIAGDWLYLKLWNGDENSYYKIKTDGSAKLKLNKDETGEFRVTEEQALKYIADNYVGYEGLTIDYIAEKSRYGVSWENPGGGSGGILGN